LGKTRENLNALHYELLEQVSGVAQLPKSVNLPKDNPGNPKEAQPELKPEEARKIVEDFKPTRDSENEDKVMALQVALNSL
jgi:hypothetical protein